MGFGNTTKQQSQTNSTQQQTEAPNVTAFRNSLYPQISNQIAEAQRPVYGQAQQAGYLNSLNKLADSSIKQLSSTLAGRQGGLNSGSFGAGVSDILQNKMGNIAGYNAQVPMLNRQAQFQNTMGALGLASNVAGPALRGSTGTSNTNSTTTEQQGLGSILGGVAGAALGGGIPFLTGQSGMLGKIFGGSGYGNNPQMLDLGQEGLTVPSGQLASQFPGLQPYPGSPMANWNSGFDFSQMGTWPGRP